MFLEGLVIVSLCLAVFGTFLLLMHQHYQTQMKMLMQLMADQSYQFQKEKSDLLNRAASKDWQTYLQVTAGMNPSQLSSNSDEPFYAMSDDNEMVRAGMAVDQSQGYGEVLAEIPSEESLLSDLRELGLVDEE